MIGPFVRQPGGDRSPPGARRPTGSGCAPTARRRAATCASRGRCSSPRAVALLVAQGQIAVFGLDDGLVAAGWITLAATLTRYADRADQILATTIYPAIVRVRERGDVLEELFAKANRLTLMWAFPFGAGLALFGADLIVFVLGRRVARRDRAARRAWRWRSRCSRSATAGSRSTGRAGESWPQAVESAVFGVVVRGAGDPGRAARRLVGVRRRPGRLHARACSPCARVYVRRLLPGVRLCGAGAAGGGAGRARVGARAGAAAARCGAASGRCGRRCWSSRCGSAALARRDAAARGRPARRAARLPARGRAAACAPCAWRAVRAARWLALARLDRGRGRLRLHAAPLPRPARRGRS